VVHGVEPGANGMRLDEGVTMRRMTARVLREHQQLLSDLRGFTEYIEPGQPDGERLRALLDFLRRQVVPFFTIEEATLDSADDPHGDVLRFEHDFLTREIDAFEVDLKAMLAHPSTVDRPEHEHGWSTLARRHQRIEALLELHVLREEAYHQPSNPPSHDPQTALDKRRGALTLEECWDVLRQVGWGVLATVGDGRPYAVPVRYGIEDLDLFFATGPGRKLGNLERTAELCLTVTDIHGPDRWRSVVVTGVVVWITDLLGQFRAVRALRNTQSLGTALRAGDVKRALSGRTARIDIREMTGRTQG
jgi:nitroimidazol reductase NimA-like FMN-containing flavoprotein (pyridoxamine 5'-phosphate oxidase superfamily)